MVDTVRTIAALQALLADNTSGDISPQDLRDMLVSLANIYEEQYTTGWEDLFTPLTAGTPSTSPPTLTAFQTTLRAYAFTAGEQLFMAFHTPHNVKQNSTAYIHVHWTTNGTNTGTASWLFEISQAKGHNQEAFPAPTTIALPATAASGIAYQHMVTEDTTGFTIEEPDELIIARVELDATTITDTVFGLAVDIHYQTDRNATKNRAPNFYT